jgi:hypothetical protein
MPYSTLSYANGPSARSRYNLSQDNTSMYFWNLNFCIDHTFLKSQVIPAIRGVT